MTCMTHAGLWIWTGVCKAYSAFMQTHWGFFLQNYWVYTSEQLYLNGHIQLVVFLLWQSTWNQRYLWVSIYTPTYLHTVLQDVGDRRSSRAVGRGGSRGFARTPLSPPKDFIYTSKLYILSALPFTSGPLVSLLLRITAVQTSLVAATECESIHGRPVQYTRERTCVNTCVNC